MRVRKGSTALLYYYSYCCSLSCVQTSARAWKINKHQPLPVVMFSSSSGSAFPMPPFRKASAVGYDNTHKETHLSPRLRCCSAAASDSRRSIQARCASQPWLLLHLSAPLPSSVCRSICLLSSASVQNHGICCCSCTSTSLRQATGTKSNKKGRLYVRLFNRISKIVPLDSFACSTPVNRRFTAKESQLRVFRCKGLARPLLVSDRRWVMARV